MSGPRMSVLHIDRDTDLPLMYTYENHTFRTAGYVRLAGRMVASVDHTGPDTAEERDTFLVKVLTAVLVPPAAAGRIVRLADHMPGCGPTTTAAGPPGGHAPGRDGTHLGLPGLLAGLVAGLVVGWLVAGGYGAVIGAFVGASTMPDVLVGGWQVRHRAAPDDPVEAQDAAAVVLVAVGSAAGGVLGYLAGPTGTGQAWGVFLGMAAAAFLLGLAATTFSMTPFRLRAVTWLGPLVVGAFAGLAHLVWSHPVAIAVGVAVGSVVAQVPARRIAGS